MAGNFTTHVIHADYPMDALSLKDFENEMGKLDVNLGDVVVVDCKGMHYICSLGLRAFLTFNKNVTAVGGKMVIRNLEPLVKNVFEMSGFSHIFNIE